MDRLRGPLRRGRFKRSGEKSIFAEDGLVKDEESEEESEVNNKPKLKLKKMSMSEDVRR